MVGDAAKTCKVEVVVIQWMLWVFNDLKYENQDDLYEGG